MFFTITSISCTNKIGSTYKTFKLYILGGSNLQPIKEINPQKKETHFHMVLDPVNCNLHFSWHHHHSYHHSLTQNCYSNRLQRKIINITNIAMPIIFWPLSKIAVDKNPQTIAIIS